MENATTPALITLSDGIERVLRFSNGALKRMRKEFGASVVFQAGLKDLDEDKLSKVLWYGLSHSGTGGEPGITEEQIDELYDAQTIGYVIGCVVKALGGSMPEKNAAKPAPAAELPATTLQ